MKAAPVSLYRHPQGHVEKESRRAECWLACCVAAEMPEPTDLDYRRIGVLPRRAEIRKVSLAYGAWLALDWMLGRRDKPGFSVTEDNYIVAPPNDPEEWKALQQGRARELPCRGAATLDAHPSNRGHADRARLTARTWKNPGVHASPGVLFACARPDP